MKNSGIEWIGEIPDGWNLIKIGSIFQCRNEKVNDTDYPPLSVSKGGIVPQMDSVAKTDANDNRKLVLENDFVINSRSDRKQSCGYSTLKGSVSLINIVLYTTNNKIILPQYTDYLMKNYGFAEEFYRWGHGIVADLWTTRWQEMKSIVLPIPSVDIQQIIADHLDEKCAAVDRLIENQQAQIEKLKEYKQSVITEAVTRGLDPSVPMKASGIEWVGNIPSHWRVSPNKYLMKKRKDICSIYKGDNILSLTMKGVVIRDLDAGGKMPSSFDGYQKIKRGNLLMCLFDIDVTPRCVGLIECDGVTSPAYSQFIMSTRAVASYYNYYYLMVDYTKELLHMAKNLRHSLTEDQFGLILSPQPPISEQQQIADYLDEKCAEIDKLIAIKQQKIETLTEYKKSLIYEYVTGKKEVVS